MATDLQRGAYSGRETFLFYNSGTEAVPVWVEIPRCRNVQITDGPSLSDIEFHGAQATTAIPGYDTFSGSFEYVRKRGADAVYQFLLDARRNRSIIMFQFLNDDIAVSGASGWTAPVLIGEFAETANGGEGVTATIPFQLADAYDTNGDAVLVVDVTIA